MTFDAIYRANSWNGRESLSGPGSGTVATVRVAEAILGIVRERGITSVLDVGCGDGFWMPDLPGYLGIDPSGEAIARARVNHPDREYLVWDGADIAERYDLVLTRDAMQHLPLADGMAILALPAAVGARWLLASTYRDTTNRDIAAGDVYTPNLEEDPFALPPPLELVPDGWDYEWPGRIRDPRKFLGLWRMT